MYCIILCYIILCYIILYYTILYYTIFYYIIFYYIILYIYIYIHIYIYILFIVMCFFLQSSVILDRRRLFARGRRLRFVHVPVALQSVHSIYRSGWSQDTSAPKHWGAPFGYSKHPELLNVLWKFVECVHECTPYCTLLAWIQHEALPRAALEQRPMFGIQSPKIHLAAQNWTDPRGNKNLQIRSEGFRSQLVPLRKPTVLASQKLSTSLPQASTSLTLRCQKPILQLRQRIAGTPGYCWLLTVAWPSSNLFGRTGKHLWLSQDAWPLRLGFASGRRQLDGRLRQRQTLRWRRCGASIRLP